MKHDDHRYVIKILFHRQLKCWHLAILVHDEQNYVMIQLFKLTLK